MEDLGREQGINFTRKKVIEQYSGFPEGKRLSYSGLQIYCLVNVRMFSVIAI